MTKLNQEIEVVTVGSIMIDYSALPAKSIGALLSRGLTHYLGSEQASKVKAIKDKHLEEHKVELADDEIAAIKADLVSQAIAKLLDGTIGVRQAGVQIDPLDIAMAKIAKQEVSDILRANGIKVPKKDEAVQFADGTSKSMADMVSARLEKNRDAIEKAAKKALADRQKQANAAKAVADAVGESKTADALGL